MFHAACRVSWEFFLPFDPPLTFADLMGPHPLVIEEFAPRDLLSNLYSSGDPNVLFFLVKGLKRLFRRDVQARVAFGDWFLARLPELVQTDVGLLSIACASETLKDAPLFDPRGSIPLVETLLGNPEDSVVRLGVLFAAILVERFHLKLLDGTDVVDRVVTLAFDGHYVVKKWSFIAIAAFLNDCEHQTFKEFVHPRIMELVFDYFDDGDDLIPGEQELINILLDLMATILKKLVFSPMDVENIAEMKHFFSVLENLTCGSDEGIAQKAKQIQAALAPIWIDTLFEEK
jgi:hypothetical protein